MSSGTITITTTATQIVAANEKRQSIVMSNNGTTTIYFGPNTSITTNYVAIVAGGTFAEDRGGGRMWMGDIYGVVSIATGTIGYWERESSL